MRLSELQSLSSSDSQTSEPPGCHTSHQAALDLLRGYWIVPLYPGRKVPKGGKGWQKARRTVDNLLPGQNVGLLLGNVYPFGGFIDLDIDSNDPQHWHRARNVLEAAGLQPDAICRTGGKHNGIRLLYAVPVAFWGQCDASGEVDIDGVTVDVRKKGQAVVPPSCPAPETKELTHPVIRPYHWQVEMPPLAAVEKMAGIGGDPADRDAYRSWFAGRGKRLANFLNKTARATAAPRDASVGKERCRPKPTSSALSGVQLESSNTVSIEDVRRLCRPGPPNTPGRGDARAARLILPSYAAIWNSPFVWWHLLKAAHLRTYGTLPDEGIAKGHTFCDPLRAERKPSVSLYPNARGEYRLHNFRDSAGDGKCASVQEFYAAYRQGKGYTEKLSGEEHQRWTRCLIEDCNIWTQRGIDLAKAPVWESNARLGAVYRLLRTRALYAARTDSVAFADNRWLATELGLPSHQHAGYALRILEAVGLIRWTGTVGSRGKTRTYELCSDGAATADKALAALRIDPDNPRTWYRIRRATKVHLVPRDPMARERQQQQRLARKRGVAAALAVSRAMRAFDRNFPPARFPREGGKLAGRDKYGNLYYSGPGPPGPVEYIVRSDAGITARDKRLQTAAVGQG